MEQSTASGLEQTKVVAGMFGRIAPRYDLMNRLMTAGLDRRWRRRAITIATATGAKRVLDVGTGTGDLALAAASVPSVTEVVGIDPAPPMLMQALRKRNTGAAPADFSLATATQLPFRDASFDAAVSGFVLRNIESLATALTEVRRVLRPGGRFVCLEITRLPPGLGTRLFGLYFERIVPLLGRFISRNGAAYTYLPASVQRFLSAEELAVAMRAAGFRRVRFTYIGPGGVAMYLAEA